MCVCARARTFKELCLAQWLSAESRLPLEGGDGFGSHSRARDAARPAVHRALPTTAGFPAPDVGVLRGEHLGAGS